MSGFFDQLDAMIAKGNSIPQQPVVRKKQAAPAPAPKAKVKKMAKEELTSNSSQEDFIEEIAKEVALFISNNRGAFDLDDGTAFDEFKQVLEVEDVSTKILEYIANPPEAEEDLDLPNLDEESEDEGTEEEQPADTEGEEPETMEDTSKGSSNDDSDYVSDDVMKLLDE